MVNTRLRSAALLALLLAFAGSAWGLTIGLAPSEDPAFAPPPGGQGSQIGFVVSGCLNALFDAGYIVSDAPVSWIAEADWGGPAYRLSDAREGAVDYVIAVYVAWARSDFHKDAYLADALRYRVIRVADRSMLAEGSVKGPADSESSSAQPSRTASMAGATVIKPCLKILSTLAMGGE